MSFQIPEELLEKSDELSLAEKYVKADSLLRILARHIINMGTDITSVQSARNLSRDCIAELDRGR